MRTPKFFYFDLGNVLLGFSHEQACEQLAHLAQTTAEQVRTVVFESGLQWRYEQGEINCEEFCQTFREKIPCQIPSRALLHAASSIFWPQMDVVPVVTHLKSAGYRLGILSNTCRAHWEHVTAERHPFLKDVFEIHILSFEVLSMKPQPTIYLAASERAGVAPEDIFFTDDRLENVEAARQLGWQAVPFTGGTELIRHLRKLGVVYNL